MERSVLGAEVAASTFDEKPENHVGLSEIVFEKAKISCVEETQAELLKYYLNHVKKYNHISLNFPFFIVSN